MVQNHRQGNGNDEKGELTRATVTTKQAHFSEVMSRSLQLPCTDSRGNTEVGKGPLPPQAQPLKHPGNFVWMMSMDMSIPYRGSPFPFGTISIHGSTGIWGHCMQVHMLAQPAWGPQLHISVVLTATYRVTPGFLPSAILPEEPECLSYRSPNQSNCWQGCSSQPDAASGPRNQTSGKSACCPPEGMDPGGIEPPWPRGVAWSRT